MNPNETPLESWKEIGAYLQRNAVTARRWEREEGLPVHRHSHKSRSSVYAYPSEIDAWRASRKAAPEPAPLWKTLLTPPRSLAFGATLALCLVMVGNGIRPQTASAQGSALVKRLVCEGDCGGSDFPDISQDGTWLVHTDQTPGNLGGLLLRNLATGQSRRLLSNSDVGVGAALSAVFSPDARQVAYFYGFKTRQLRVIANEPGAAPRILADNPDYTDYYPQAWSVDGKAVLTLLQKPDRTWQLAWVSAENGSIRQLVSLGWRLRDPDKSASLSPDGRYIAYAALAVNPKAPPAPVESTDQHIYVVASDGSGGAEVVKGAGIHSNPVWATNGRHLLFKSDQSGKIGLWSIPMQNGRPTGPAALVLADSGQLPIIGMRSGSLFYAQRQDALDYVSVARLDNPRVTQDFVGLYPSWSPDGKLLAFTRPRPSVPNEVNLVVHNMETGEEKVYGHAGLKTHPSDWFHESASLIKRVREADGTESIYRVDLKTGEFKLVAVSDVGTNFPISSDDKTIYMSARAPQSAAYSPATRVVALDVATGQQRPVFSMPQGRSFSGLRLSPDGKTLLLGDTASGASYLALVSIDGSNYREIYNGAMGGMNWMPDGRGILFSQRTEGTAWRVMRIPVEGGAPQFTGFEVANQDQRLLLSPHPDGSRIAFSNRKASSQLWALDNLAAVLK